MTRAFAFLFAAVTVLAGPARRRPKASSTIARHHGRRPRFLPAGCQRIEPDPAHDRELHGNYAPGTIYINTAERRLYLVLANGQALRYGIGVGRDGFRWSGTHRITAKKEWPSWTPPAQMLRRRPDLPRHMSGGIDNPLGARAMYLGSTLTASTAPTNPRRSDRRCRPDASA
jgi:lipoprotein-anchoring transpeptidase ErfK/SrfK